MKCSKCQNEIQKGYKFCPICGTPVTQEIKCPKCGSTDIPQDSKFCPDCGALLRVNQEEAQRRFENAKKQEEEKARKRKQAESAKQQEIARKRELERKAVESKRAELEKTRREAEAIKRAEETKKTYINGHEYVDLGLPSGTKWATCNIGANVPEESGDYYGWGETYPKRDFTSSQWNDTFATLLKMMGVIDSNKNLKPKHDAANIKWGKHWRLPTFADVKELIANTNRTWTTQNGVYGLQIRSKVNSNCIFIPAAGDRFMKESCNNRGECGYYWCSSFDSDEYRGISFGFYSDRDIQKYTYGGKYGYPIRPVAETY